MHIFVSDNEDLCDILDKNLENVNFVNNLDFEIIKFKNIDEYKSIAENKIDLLKYCAVVFIPENKQKLFDMKIIQFYENSRKKNWSVIFVNSKVDNENNKNSIDLSKNKVFYEPINLFEAMEILDKFLEKKTKSKV